MKTCVKLKKIAELQKKRAFKNKMSLKYFSEVIKQLETWIYDMLASTCLSCRRKLRTPCCAGGDLRSQTSPLVLCHLDFN